MASPFAIRSLCYRKSRKANSYAVCCGRPSTPSISKLPSSDRRAPHRIMSLSMADEMNV